jgi:hypothetical protein
MKDYYEARILCGEKLNEKVDEELQKLYENISS